MKQLMIKILRPFSPVLSFGHTTLTKILRKIHMDQHPRVYSNTLLRVIGPHVKGSVINVSGWKDSDKYGRRYRDYFPEATSYHVSNYSGSRGSGEVDSITNLFLDLQAPIPAEVIGKYDVVFNHTTLEHLASPEIAFDVLTALTNDLLILVVPFAQEVHFIPGSFGDYLRFSPGALAAQLHKRGMSCLVCNTNPGDYFPQYVFFVASKYPERHQHLKTFGNQKWQSLMQECISHV